MLIPRQLSSNIGLQNKKASSNNKTTPSQLRINLKRIFNLSTHNKTTDNRIQESSTATITILDLSNIIELLISKTINNTRRIIKPKNLKIISFGRMGTLLRSSTFLTMEVTTINLDSTNTRVKMTSILVWFKYIKTYFFSHPCRS